jgi:hypothetical protein
MGILGQDIESKETITAAEDHAAQLLKQLMEQASEQIATPIRQAIENAGTEAAAIATSVMTTLHAEIEALDGWTLELEPAEIQVSVKIPRLQIRLNSPQK